MSLSNMKSSIRLFIIFLLGVYFARIQNSYQSARFHIPVLNIDKKYSEPTLNVSETSSLVLQDLYSLNPSMEGDNIYLLWPVDPNIKARPLCAAESWSLHHPYKKVWFILTSKVAENSDNLIQRLLDTYPNLKFAYVDVENLLNNTPFQVILQSNIWKKGTSFAEVNLSDLVRLALVSRTGGMYVDTDAIAIKNIDKFGYFIGVPHKNDLTNNMFYFNRTSPFLKGVIDHIAKNFKSNSYGWNGPVAMTAVGKKLCGQAFLSKLGGTEVHTCYGINFPPTKAFYPIWYPSFKKYFQDGLGKNIDKMLNDSYAIHIWNRMSRKVTTYFGSESIFEVVARSNCPITYNSMKMRSDHL